MRFGRTLVTIVTGLLMQVVPVHAQEVTSILRLKEWQALGVCVGIKQCAFCSATDSLRSGAVLRITPPAEVAVFFANGGPKIPVTIEIGPQTFSLTSREGDTFTLNEPDSAKVIRAMQHERALTVHTGSEGAAVRYRYSLVEFPRAYSAILGTCHGAR